ncbi:hypothetical protein RF679_13460 [Undibacterium cyanobacteriorum]|uniref:Ig-like domain-containing protein n=1 Tax=Undibacterium cyanobacteriorum TaxID=3073561 RepID=A0ABY9REK3_9BURK|nr:hypothetical protein [Undibacterium sp. 20NA77.5]WMW79653.1 hypothetical protein RF679_13460 [Undibacterium sp. 20NA77.5]
MISQKSNRGSAKVVSKGSRYILSMSLCASLFACGGGDSSAPLTPPPEIKLATANTVIEAGATNLPITATATGSTSAINWSIEGNLGSLSTTTGNVVEYVPPPTGTVDLETSVKITASSGSLNKTITLTLRPSASGVYAFAGGFSARGYIDASGNDARFSLPTDIVADAEDNLYVWDLGNRRIRRMTKDGAVTTFTLADLTTQSGGLWYKLRNLSGRFVYVNKTPELQLTEPQAQLIYPDGHRELRANYDQPAITAYHDIDGNIYSFSSFLFDKRFGVIQKNGVVLAGNEAASVAKDGLGKDARFVSISQLLVSPNRTIYVLDKELVSGKYQLRRVTQEGGVTTLSTSRFEAPARMIPNTGAVPSILDRTGIHKLQENGDWLSTTVTDAGLIPSKNVETDTYDATADKDGNIYLTDPNQHRIVRVTAQGKASVFAGMLNSVSTTGALDGRLDAARMLSPYAMTKDRLGNLYVMEETPNLIDAFGQSWKQNALSLRKIAVDGSVSTLSALGIWFGKADTKKTAETFRFPTNIAVDNNLNMWIFDRPVPDPTTGNPPARDDNFLFKISADGNLTKLTTKITDCSPYSRVWMMCGVVFDGKDSMFVADGGGVFKLSAEGVKTSVSGMETFGAVSALAFDKQGNMYFAGEQSVDPGIYKRSVAGTVTKLHRFNFKYSSSMLVDEQGNVYDYDVCSLVKINANGTKTVLVGSESQCGLKSGNLVVGRLHNVKALAWLGQNSIFAASSNSVLKVVF